MEDILHFEKLFLNKNLSKLQSDYPDKYVLIRGDKVLGEFDTYDEGVDYGIKNFKGAPFLVRNVMHPEDRPADVPALSLGIPLSCRR